MNKELHNNMKTKRRFNRKHSSITEIKLLYLLTSWKTIIKNRLVSDHITLKTLHNWDKEVALIKFSLIELIHVAKFDTYRVSPLYMWRHMCVIGKIPVSIVSVFPFNLYKNTSTSFMSLSICYDSLIPLHILIFFYLFHPYDLLP